MPVLLVGAFAVLIQHDLDLGESQLGIAIAASFAAGATVAAPAGRVAEWLGPRRTVWIGLAFADVSLLGIGLVADGWVWLALFLAAGGVGLTSVQLGVNVLVTRVAPPRYQGTAFGLKQAAVPLAALLAGLALPTIGLTVGWRAAFLVGALTIPIVALLIPNGNRASFRRPPTSEGGSARLSTLVLLTVGVALAAAGGNSAPAFIVPSLVDRGLAPAHAGLVFASASLVGIVVRASGGWLGDRLGHGSLLLVAALVTAGALGYAGLAVTEHPLLLGLFTALAFGGGWGWGGLMLLALSRANPAAPGRAMGVVQVGPMTGAVVGPIVFGMLAEQFAYAVAWAAMAVLALLGVAMIMVSRTRLRHGRNGHAARPLPR